jgi:DNA polymerase III, delta subunit
MAAYIFLTQTHLDLRRVSGWIALKLENTGKIENLDVSDVQDSTLALETWQKMQAGRRVIQLDINTKEDFRNNLDKLYEVYPEPTLLFLGDVNQYSLQLQEGLLRLLEEPPSNLQVILFAQSRGQILPTIVSRARLFNLSQQVIMSSLPTALLHSVKTNLPPPSDFIKKIIAKTSEKTDLPDLSKIDRDELDFWLWQLQTYLTKIYEQTPDLRVARSLKKVMKSRKLNSQNVQKKLALSQITLPVD